MCGISTAPTTVADRTYLEELTEAGLLIPLGVPGIYGHSGVFEEVLERFDHYVTLCAADLHAEVIRFPAILNREHYLKTSHIHHFPDLMGSVHSFTGNERDHAALLAKREIGEDWTRDLTPTAVMLTPATCYPLYPTATGTLPEVGRTVDLRSYVFRHEPSNDPARMQLFRQREFVRLGTAEQALQHRSYWLALSEQILNDVGLPVEIVIANDPFFGRGGRVMAATQKEQVLKHELVIPIANPEKPTAIASVNCHLDYFGQTFDIKTPNGTPAHSACIGFGLERIALALFKTHGFDPNHWPADVKSVLEL